jgi:anionic cell wall polymer biosynthesis LytR-Cps2A-Psr (LCP) family protein
VYGVGHLGQSYTYGDGRESSVENLVEAVEKLLNVPVNDYFITNRGSLEYINDIVGGVTVTVPNDDLVEKHPEMTEGAEVEITDDLVEDYVRYRDTTIDFSNEGRIDRQSSYINAYIEKLQSMLPDQITDIWETLEDIDHFIQTSVTKNKYLQYANLLNAIEYGEGDFIKLPGEDVNGEDYDEFYVDEDALRELVVDLFYLPA